MSRVSQNEVLRKAPFDEDKDDIKALIDQGWSDSQIAQKYDVTKDTIWCRRQRWRFLSGAEMKERQLVDSITTLWQAGYSVSEMTDVLNISAHTIYLKMRYYDIRSIPRMNIDAPSISVSELTKYVSDSLDADEKLVVTYKRQPRFVLVPVDDYHEMTMQLENGAAA